MTNEVNTARLVRVTSTVPDICIHNFQLGPGFFCPHCPTASIEEVRRSFKQPDRVEKLQQALNIALADVAFLRDRLERRAAEPPVPQCACKTNGPRYCLLHNPLPVNRPAPHK